MDRGAGGITHKVLKNQYLSKISFSNNNRANILAARKTTFRKLSASDLLVLKTAQLDSHSGSGAILSESPNAGNFSPRLPQLAAFAGRCYFPSQALLYFIRAGGLSP